MLCWARWAVAVPCSVLGGTGRNKAGHCREAELSTRRLDALADRHVWLKGGCMSGRLVDRVTEASRWAGDALAHPCCT